MKLLTVRPETIWQARYLMAMTVSQVWYFHWVIRYQDQWLVSDPKEKRFGMMCRCKAIILTDRITSGRQAKAFKWPLLGYSVDPKIKFKSKAKV